ncbi:hypothetical protein AAC387_Pa03g1227 [Persea americana]
MPIQSFTLKDHTALPFPYLPHVQASSSRTGVTRGRVSPCHLFPSSFAFPLGEMPNEGRRRMKIKLDKPHGVLSRAERRPCLEKMCKKNYGPWVEIQTEVN